MQGDKRRRLPVWRTVGETYRETFHNLLYAIRISWAWFVLLVVVGIAIAIQSAWLLIEDTSPWNLDVSFMALATESPPASTVIMTTAAIPAAIFLYLLAWSSISVAWHRRLLAGETCSWIVYLNIGRNVWRYLGYYILLFLIFVLIVFAVGLVVGISAFGLAWALYGLQPPAQSPLVVASMIALMFVAFLFVVLVMIRLSVLLPGVALGHKDVSLRGIWRTTKGNSWRLLLATILCWLAPSLLLGGVSITFSMTQRVPGLQAALSTGNVLLAIGNQVVTLLIGFIGLSLLSFCYRFFYEPQDAEQPPDDATL